MNKMLMALTTESLLRFSGYNAIADHCGTKVATPEEAYLGAMRSHGLLPDDWVRASVERQVWFAKRDHKVPDSTTPEQVAAEVLETLDNLKEAYDKSVRSFAT